MKKEKALCHSASFQAQKLPDAPPEQTSSPVECKKGGEDKAGSSPVSDTVNRKLPERFLLLKFGKNAYSKETFEGEFIFTSEDADTVIKEFLKRKKDLVIDFEHQSVTGGKAPAAGWIKALEKSPEGLWAIVKYWTKEAERLILDGQYRYFSPTLYFSEDGEKVIALHSVALTNHPALHNIPALAASDSGELLQENTSERSALTLTQLSLLADLQKKESQWNAFLEKYSCSSFADMAERLDKAQELFQREKIRIAFQEGKLTENMRQWAEELLKKDEALFDSYMQCAPRSVPDNRLPLLAAPAHTPVLSDPEEEEIFAMLGLTQKNKEKSAENI